MAGGDTGLDGVVFVGGAAVGLFVLGREVGKLGSVGDPELVTGMPCMPDWQPASSAHAASAHARTSRAIIEGQGY